jgi:hypothetical protein
VTIVLRHSERLDLNLVEYRGVISFANLQALAGFVAARPDHMRRDALNLVLPGARFRDVDAPALDKLFSHYRKLYAPLEFQMLRRAAWICRSEAASLQVRHWLSKDTVEGMTSTVRQFDTYAEAGEWLVLNTEEIALLECGDTFTEIDRFESAPILAR